MRDVYLFFALACGITWLLDAPLALAWTSQLPPPSYAMPLVALGAFGPTLAASAIALRRRELRDVFGRWRTNPVWIVVALVAPMAIHLPATLMEVALGGSPAQWFYLPVAPEHVAALVVFSVGEEFGWRGYAHPRLVQRFGPVAGCLILGLVWGLWHLGMQFTPEKGAPELSAVALATAELALYSVVIGWVFERANYSMAVAIAFHMGAHLDNVNRAPETEVRLRILRFVVLFAVAAVAGWSLTRRRK